MSAQARVTRLGFLEVRTPDVARHVAYCTDELGLVVVEGEGREA